MDTHPTRAPLRILLPIRFLVLAAATTLASVTVVTSCSTPASAPGSTSTASARGAAELDQLVAWMSGSFSSAAQAARTAGAPRDHSYFDVRLHMTPIWSERTDGRWLYVEQALASQPERPYRQRVYRVRAEDGGFASDVFLLPGTQEEQWRLAGAWSDATRLAGLSPERLVMRDGCSIHLTRRADGVFTGSTTGNRCPSERQGAAYATSHVEIRADLLTSWDRGFDASGKQVWGAIAGPYEFVKD